jgi:NAD+ kinase
MPSCVRFPTGRSEKVGDVTRSVLLLAHTGRDATTDAARQVIKRLQAAGVEVRVLAGEAAEMGITDVSLCSGEQGSAAGVELVLVLGGDGTILRAAELARDAGVPLLGVNLGRVGFLAEAEPEDLETTIEQVLARSYVVHERMTLDVHVIVEGKVIDTGWALNECSVEKGRRERMLEVMVEIDGRPLSRWGCDGVVVATPTGSTAYAFSAGGPVVWPTVDALLVVPISAHALFARPLVASPTSVVGMEILATGNVGAVACDGRRSRALPHGSRVEVRRGADPVLLASTRQRPFTDTLVEKFKLPVEGWRSRTD